MTPYNISLRDYFAGLAMQAFYTQYPFDSAVRIEGITRAYVIADAMLAEREKGNKQV